MPHILTILARLVRRPAAPLRCACGAPALCTDDHRRPLCAACAIRQYARVH